jgi:hypothetical protein
MSEAEDRTRLVQNHPRYEELKERAKDPPGDRRITAAEFRKRLGLPSNETNSITAPLLDVIDFS